MATVLSFAVMVVRRFHRYILREIAVPTGLALFVFTFILFMGRILKLAEMVINKGVPAAEIAALFAYLLPAFLVITLPLSFLLGVLLGFSRLSADSEIVALQSSGVSLYGLLPPVVALAFAASVLTALLTLVIEPAGNSAFRREVFRIASSQAFAGLQPQTFNDDFDGLVIYANAIDERSGKMQGVFISDERAGSVPSTILARSGRVVADPASLTLSLRLESGSIHRQAKQETSAYQTIGFSTYEIHLNLGGQTVPEYRPKKANEISTADLWRGSSGLVNVDARKLTTELHQRFIFPFAPLLFALIGVPLGIQTQRSGRGGGFAVGLAVFLAYYVLLSLGETLATEGGWHPASLWLPNLLFFAGGLLLLVQTAREKRFAPFGGIFDRLRRHSRFRVTSR